MVTPLCLFALFVPALAVSNPNDIYIHLHDFGIPGADSGKVGPVGDAGLLYPTREALWNRMDGVVNREFEASQPPYKMSFKDMINSKYYPEDFNGTWISDTEIVYPDQFGGLSIYNVATSRIQTVLRRNM